MKNYWGRTSFVYAAAGVLLSPVATFAKPVQMPVAFRAMTSVNKGRHISAKSGGGLMLGSTVLGNKEVFRLIDVNGGSLQEGDSVQVTYAGKRPTYWRENAGFIARSADKPDKNCLFKVKWKQSQKVILLRAASGKWVSGPGKGRDLITLAKASDPTLVFELLKILKLRPSQPKIASPKAAKTQGKTENGARHIVWLRFT